MTDNKKIISFVIPCYKSEKSIEQVIDEINDVVSKNEKFDYEVVAVNDYSPDNVWQVLNKIASNNKKVKCINLAKNMNRPGAVMAGLNNVSGNYIVMMDDDGQCPMDKLWEIIKPLEDGHDVAMAKYTKYRQSLFKSFGTVVNKKMSESIIGQPKDMEFTNFIAIKRYICDEIVKYKNPYIYYAGLILRTTDDIINVPMEERSRLYGGTTFTLKKMISIWMDGFTAFSIKPLRISTVIGFIMAIVGLLYAVYIVIDKLFIHTTILQGYSSIMAALLFIGGIIMIMLGMIGEYIGRIYISINDSPQYVIKESINVKKEKGEHNEKN